MRSSYLRKRRGNVARWLLASSLFGLASCGDPEPSPGPAGPGPEAETSTVTTMPQTQENTMPASDAPAKTVEITGNDLMKFNVESFTVAPGQEVTLKFTNVGTMPKISMGHNWVLLVENTDVLGFLEPGFTHASNDYIAPEMEKKIIARTAILGPGETESVTFNAPRKKGAYEYICTFPGHWAAGMKGIMTVQ